jgi:1-acyl-sn-glycerol-3-phosphate acyltransferase
MKSMFAGKILFSLWAYIAFTTIMIPGCLLVLLAPSLSLRRKINKLLAIIVLLSVGQKLPILRKKNLPRNFLFIANHGSFIDAIILAAVLPSSTSFLIKYEARKIPIAGLFLSRINSLFVKRDSIKSRARSLKLIKILLMSNNSIAIFPEGTFDKNIGIKRFHRGGFTFINDLKTSVIPIGIRGAREMMPSESWLISYCRLEVFIDFSFETSNYASAEDLSRAARKKISLLSNEPITNG